MTSNKVWLPVEDGEITHNVAWQGEWIYVMEEYTGNGNEVTAWLPADRRLCKLVDAPAPAAWGPPMAQPDAEGWWAFQGQTPDELGLRLLAEVYPADPDGGDLELFAETDRAGGGYYAYEMTGTWRKLLVDPWEAES